MLPYCSECGGALDEGIRYCPNCGAAAPIAGMDAAFHQQEMTAGAQYGDQRGAQPEYIDPPAGQYGDGYAEDSSQGEQHASSAYAPPTYASQPSAYAQQPRDEEPAPAPDGPYAPVGMGAFIGVQFLMRVPVINLIVMIIWACGGCRRINLRNYARGALIVMLIDAILAILFIAGIVTFLGEYMQDLSYLFDYYL